MKYLSFHAIFFLEGKLGPIKYIDHKYQEIVVRGQAGVFSPVNDAQQNALQHILSVIRFLNALVFIPFFIFDFIGVNLGIRRKPEPRLEQLGEMVQAEKAAEHHRKTGGKTLGFHKGGKK